MNHNLFRSIVDTVHSSEPCHLVGCFQFLCHALSGLHLLNNQGQTLLCLLVQIGKVSPELPLQNQVIEHHWVMLFQILSVHPSVFSDRAFLIGKLPIRDVVISNQYVFDIVDTLSSHLCSLLQEQALDFCIISRRDGIDTFIPLCENTICIWVPQSHPAVEMGIYPLQDLANENYISIHPNMETDNSRLLAKHHITPHICASTSDVPAAWTMVAAGMGVTLINRILSRQWDGPVVTLPLDTSPSFEIGIAAPVREMQSPAAAELMKFMQKDLIHAFE